MLLQGIMSLSDSLQVSEWMSLFKKKKKINKVMTASPSALDLSEECALPSHLHSVHTFRGLRV